MLLLSLISFSQPAIEGKWKSEENGSVIEIYSKNNMFIGKIINVSDAKSNDKIGHLLLNSLVYNNSTRKYEGKVKSTSGNTAQCEIELVNENKFKLTVTKLFIRKIQIFIRTK
jgi:hypothetical protein